jgi:hypothetical protein
MHKCRRILDNAFIYAVVCYATLAAAIFKSPYAIAVLAIISVNRSLDEILLYFKNDGKLSELKRIDAIETELQQVNLALHFKNLHK